MPQWAGSSWYYLRYIDPHNTEALVDKEKETRWSPVDVYVGGLEHATRHLIYARFWHKFLFDIGTVSTTEPFEKLYTVGLILAEDGRKMSKRWGNVINPDDVVGRMGADALRVYEMFMGPFGQAIAWSTDHMVGARRFLERVYGLREKIGKLGEENTLALQQTIKKVTLDIDTFSFNTAISQLMILVNDMEKRTSLAQSEYETLLTLLAPFAPHLTEELWEGLGHDTSVHLASWPTYDSAIIAHAEVTIAVQVNGKMRGTFTASPEATQEELLASARVLPTVAVHLEGKTVAREIVVPKRLVSFVVK
jgi:leucyl-tRNA synthetase